MKPVTVLEEPSVVAVVKFKKVCALVPSKLISITPAEPEITGEYTNVLVPIVDTPTGNTLDEIIRTAKPPMVCEKVTLLR